MKDDRVYLQHVRDAIARIRDYTAGGREAFFADPRTQDAVIRNLEIIGEAVKQVSETTRASRSDVPWKLIAGMRDILIHQYFGVKLELVWQVVESNLDALAEAVTHLLEELQNATRNDD